MIKLPAKPHDDLNWKIEGTPSLFEFDLGLHEPYFPLEDELYFQSLCASLAHFTKEIWPQFPESRAILYRGSADFSLFFSWSEAQESNFETWKEGRVETDLLHQKRLFCAEAFLTYFQMLAHRLPDEMGVTLILNPENTGTLAQSLQLLSTERFEHFQIETGFKHDSPIGVCIPPDSECSEVLLNQIDALLPTLQSFRPVYETHLTEQWDGLDEIIAFSDALTSQGKRKLKGFEAAGGKVTLR